LLGTKVIDEKHAEAYISVYGARFSSAIQVTLNKAALQQKAGEHCGLRPA